VDGDVAPRGAPEMKKYFLLFLFLCVASAGFFIGRPAYSKEESLACEIPNFHVVAPGVMRGAQPSADALGCLREYYGVKTILDLRDDMTHIEWEKEIVEKQGMLFISIPMNSSQEQGVEKIEQCLGILNDKSKQPVFVHCEAGKDRAGMIVAAYRIKYDNWNIKDALLEMLSYGYDPIGCFKLEEALSRWDSWRQDNTQVH